MDKPTRILVVDDDRAIVQMLSRLLSSQGYEVWVAEGGQEGLIMTYDVRPDLVLLDVMMADLNGFEVCRRIKEDPVLVDVFVALFSGEATESPNRITGLTSGADDYIVKSTPPNELLARLRNLVRLRNTTAALRESEERHRRLVEILPDGVALIDLHGLPVSFNPQAAAMLGYSSSRDMVNISPLDLVQAEDRERLKADLATVLETGTVRNREYLLRRQTGEGLPVELSAALLRSPDQQPLVLVAVGRDVTERKQAGAILQAQRDLAMFLSSANDPSRAAERLLAMAVANDGIDCGEMYLADDRTGDLTLAAHRGLSEAFVRQVAFFAGGSAEARRFRCLEAFRWKRGELGPVLDTAMAVEGLRCGEAIPIRHGKKLVAVFNVGSHLRDEIPARSRQVVEAMAAQIGGAIARIRAEQSLRLHRELLEKTIHGLYVAVFVVDAETDTIQECNPAATRSFGYPREDLIGRPLASLHLDPLKAEEFRQHLHAAAKNRGHLSDFEFKMARRDGTVFPAEHTVTPIRNDEGKILSWVHVISDITRRKQNEEEARLLPRRIIEAQEAERLRVARELHDGVNQILASARMRLRKVEEIVAATSPASREMLARCERQLVSALEENRRIAYNLRPSGLDELGLLEACRQLCKDFESQTHLPVHCDLPETAPRLAPAAEVNLFRILQEGLNNVDKHAQATTVRLTMKFEPDAVLLTLADDGRGFDPHAPQPRKNARSGIGLSNIRERALSLGGTCEVKGTPRHGTTITVRIPGTEV